MSHYLSIFITVISIIVVAPIEVQGKITTVQTEYVYHLPENISIEEAKDLALQRAKIQAIADEFGTLVTQTSTTNIDILNGQTTTDFLSIGGSEVKGEWLETIGTPSYEIITDGSQMAIKVCVKGKVRETEGSKVPFDIKILRNGITQADESDKFMTGDSFFLSFSSPVSGYLAVYLIDSEKKAYCLLPYQSIETGNFLTKANKKYLFFHPGYAEGVESASVDEYILETSFKLERNRILAIFSPNKFFKANDYISAAELPRSLSYDDFQKWLSSIKKKDINMSIVEKAITISSGD